LRAYYHGTSIPAGWAKLTEALTDLYLADEDRVLQVRGEVGTGQVPMTTTRVKAVMRELIVSDDLAKQWRADFAAQFDAQTARLIRKSVDFKTPQTMDFAFYSALKLADMLVQQVLATTPKI
jgi:hypothetical protein